MARHTADLEAVIDFYRDRVGLREIGRFADHDGYDGGFLELHATGAHLEFTTGGGHRLADPHPESLLGFYLDDEAAIADVAARIGRTPVKPTNPYWQTRALTFVDPDGYHLVLVTRQEHPEPSGERP